MTNKESSKPAVIIADDHRMVAEGIAHLIEKGHAGHVCAIASTLGEAEALLTEHQPDVLLLDVALSDGDGIDALPVLAAVSPTTHFVVLTMYAEPSVIRRALEVGVEGYLLKSAGVDELIAAIQTVTGGGTYICREAKSINRKAGEAPPALTPREREVLRLIVQGKTIKEIADELCLSFETIHSYTKYLRLKLDCNNTASLVRVAMERHLV